MTREEAIRIIISDRLTAMEECQMFGKCEDKDCWECGDNQAFSMAIEALKGGDAQMNEIKNPYYMQQSRHDDGKIEVVRCKDCMHRSEGGWCDVYIQPRMETDFCNHGERQCNYFGERKEP